MHAIILAGGRGTRLRSVVSDLPKPMAPVNGSPFLEHLMQKLINEGVQSFTLAVGYMSDSIVQYFGSQFQGKPVRYSVEATPMGTGGAVLQAVTGIKAGRALVVNGDTYLFSSSLGLRNLINSDAVCNLLAISCPDVARYGCLKLNNDGRLLEISEKGEKGEGLINTGIYAFDVNYLRSLSNIPCSLELDILPKLIGAKLVSVSTVIGSFIDIGVPTDYRRAQQMFSATEI